MVEKLTHGGDIVGFYEKYGEKPLDFSANISPLGLPKAVKQGIINAIEEVEHYPDPLCRALTLEIANHEKVEKDWILCGNGAADLIFRVAQTLKPKRALVLAPTFAEYEQALDTVDCATEQHLLASENDFELTESILPKIKKGLDILFICQPNNPTGRVIAKPLLEKIIEKCSENSVYLMVDECFVDFLDAPQAFTSKEFLKENPRLIILKAFTKTYAMAGLRLGYILCNNQALISRLRASGQAWAVSTVAQTAGVLAIKDRQYVEDMREIIKTQREFLLSSFKNLGLKTYGSQGNFIFFYSEVESLFEKLSHQRILIRNCENYKGLGQGFYRVAVRTHRENAMLISAIEKVINDL